MSNYETIKNCALQFMTRNKMSSMYYEKEDYQKYFDEAIHLMEDVLEFLNTYQEDFAAYVVAYNVVGSNTRQIFDMGNNRNLLFYCNVALLYKAKLLAKSTVYLGRHISNDKCAEFLVGELTQAYFMALTTWNKTEEGEVKELVKTNLLNIITLCANSYQVALSFHPSLVAAKNMWEIFNKTLGNADDTLIPQEKLRPIQMKELCESVEYTQNEIVRDTRTKIGEEYQEFLNMLKKKSEMILRRWAYDELLKDGWNNDACKYDYRINDSIVKLFLEPYIEYLDQDKYDLLVERCCLHETEDFNWFYTIDDIFIGYEKICQENGIIPIKFNRFASVKKIPFINSEDLKKIFREVVHTFLDLREHNIYGCGKLPSYLTSDDILDFVEEDVEDQEFAIYLINLATFIIEYDSTKNEMAMLGVVFEQFRHTAITKDIHTAIDICKSKIENILGPYTDRLKHIGILPKDWKYTFTPYMWR